MKRPDPKTTKQQELMEKILNDPKYRGKHVIVVAGEVFTANTGEGAGKILDEVDKKYPDEIPAVTYIPDADTLILTAPHGPPFVHGNVGNIFFFRPHYSFLQPAL